MSKFFQASAMTCAAVCISLALASSPAKAETEQGDAVRAAQMRLASLGYYVGRYDGTMGPVTKEAVIDFQSANGLSVTGQLNTETYTRLMHQDFLAYHPEYDSAYRHMSYVDPYQIQTPVMWDNRWNYAQTQELPLRYGHLEVIESRYGGVRHYTVTLNNQPVLFANNQPGLLRISQTYHMDKEDAVIFTAYHGDGVCGYRNYLLTVHSNGSFTTPHEIGNCNGNYEAHVADNKALFVSFAGVRFLGVQTWDTWRYEDDQLDHLL